ncbi:MAG: transglycosylase SLT domain-containing protein, partial [Proteobacteria bacterium]|nr:transglycosylase SLT domain-containing protein [Pseudomonadota bacterium]
SQVRYFANKPDFLDRTFERAERYLYYVVRELEARDMPLELALLPVIESAYNPYAYSRARAAGIWQFIAPTARRYEVRVNWWQDGRRDIVDSTRAALDYLSELHTMFGGDWFLAIAAYNCGEAAVQRAVLKARRAGKPADFWHLKLPRETRGYVPSLLAMARIVAEPEKYGLEFAPIANRPYFAQVEVGSQIDLRLAAMLLSVAEDELHELNPAFNRWATDPDGPHHLLVPAAAAAEFARTVAALSPESRMPVEHYRVGEGETLMAIARDRDLPPNTIVRMNGLHTAELHAGDDLVLPASRVAPLRAGLIIEGETPLPGHHRRTYVVRRGETLASIARRNHVGVEELAQLNGLTPYSAIKAGNTLIVDVSDRKVRHRKRKGHASHPARELAAPRPQTVGALLAPATPFHG